MKVAEFLKKAGAKAGFIRIVEEAQKEELRALQTKNLSLLDLQEQFTKSHDENMSTVAPELKVTFDKVFEALKLPAFAHGWNIYKVKELLGSEEFKKLQPAAVRKALIEELKNKNIPEEDLVKDALHRDKALDSYEEFVTKKVGERAAVRHNEIKQIEEVIEDCRQKMSKLRSTQSKEEKQLKDWLESKTKLEEELVNLVSVITSQHSITVGKQTNKDTT